VENKVWEQKVNVWYGVWRHGEERMAWRGRKQKKNRIHTKIDNGCTGVSQGPFGHSERVW